MARAGESIELIIPKRLASSPIRQTRPIADGVVGIRGLVDRGTRRRQLMEDLGDLTGRIVP